MTVHRRAIISSLAIRVRSALTLMLDPYELLKDETSEETVNNAAIIAAGHITNLACLRWIMNLREQDMRRMLDEDDIELVLQSGIATSENHPEVTKTLLDAAEARREPYKEQPRRMKTRRRMDER